MAKIKRDGSEYDSMPNEGIIIFFILYILLIIYLWVKNEK